MQRAIQQSSEAMHKTLEDSSQKKALSNSSYLATESKTSLKEEEHVHTNVTDYVTDYSPTEHDYRSEEIDDKYSRDCDTVAHKTAQIRKSQSVGSGLNWDEKTSEEEMEQKYSDDGSVEHSRSIAPDSSEQFPEQLPSDSVRVHSAFTKNLSIFSIGDPEQTEREVAADKDDIYASVEVNSGEVTPTTPHLIVKSSSLPRLGSPTRYPGSFLPHSRSAEDMNTLDARKKDTMRESGRQVEYQQRDESMHKNTGENPADETDEHYNYVDSAKDWIVPASDRANMGKGIEGETSFNHWNEVPAKDFRLKRIEDWVINLQECGPLEESNEPAPCDDQESPKDSALTVEQTVPKVDVKVTPGMEAAKRYISSLNSSTTAAQLTNLGLVVIPFLSVFNSLKALNLSGNSIGLFVICSFMRLINAMLLSDS